VGASERFSTGWADPRGIFGKSYSSPFRNLLFLKPKDNPMNQYRFEVADMPIGALWDYWLVRFGEASTFDTLKQYAYDTHCFEHAVAGRLQELGYLKYDLLTGKYILIETPWPCK